MKIYFAASIRGGRDDAAIYKEIIDRLKTFGEVLTEHFGNQNISAIHGTDTDNARIYAKDMAWVREADLIVAEVTQPSLGVGYELGSAEAMGKKIICLFRETGERSLSAMIAGNPYPNQIVIRYTSIDDLFTRLPEALLNLNS